MKKRIQDYLRQTDALINAGTSGTEMDWNAVLAVHLQQISFFQHERLVHLLVTLAFGIISTGVGIVLYVSFSPLLCLLLFALMCLLIPYVFHYYLLENSVQKMYQQYDEIRCLSGNCADVCNR